MQKTVLITGASRGIGRSTAEAFAAAGYAVGVGYLAAAREAKELTDAINSGGGRAIAVCADVADRVQVAAMVEQVSRELGSIDVLVNNAGIAQQKLFTDITQADWDRMMNVDLKGVFHCCQEVLPPMLRRHSGKIINVSSIWGMVGASCEVHYSAAKAAVIGLTKALAKEVGPSGIQVNCVAPGIVQTEMNRALTDEDARELADCTPLQRFGTPQEIAQTILFLASEQADFITGQVISPNGGFVI